MSSHKEEPHLGTDLTSPPRWYTPGVHLTEHQDFLGSKGLSGLSTALATHAHLLVRLRERDIIGTGLAHPHSRTSWGATATFGPDNLWGVPQWAAGKVLTGPLVSPKCPHPEGQNNHAENLTGPTRSRGTIPNATQCVRRNS